MITKQEEERRNQADVDPNEQSAAVEESKEQTSSNMQHVEEEPTMIENNTRHEGFNVPIHIDGKKIIRKIKKMHISRLIKLDGNQASMPIQTFLPFPSEIDP
mgnify:CR=1 FL=1